jgi:hypothetical protein
VCDTCNREKGGLKMIRKLSIVVLIFGVVSIVIGAIFISQGIVKNNMLVTAMQQEKITLGIPSDKIAAGEVIDNAEEAQIAADTVREHRHEIAPTYEDLLAGGHFDPTNPTDLSYAQAMNIENYLYLAVLGFGLTQVVIASGVVMIITGIALSGTGVALFRLAKKQ